MPRPRAREFASWFILTVLAGGALSCSSESEPIRPRGDNLPLVGALGSLPTVSCLFLVVDRPAPEFLDAYRLQPLKYAEKDARDLAGGFQSLGVPPGNITTLRNVESTRASISRELRKIAAKSTAPDTLFVFFLGHGIADGAGASQLIAHDGPLPVKDLLELLGNVPAQRLILVMDACRSGEAGQPRFLAEMPELRRPNGGLAWISSAKSGQSAYEASELKNGVFSYHLAKVLRHSQEYDTDHNGWLDWEEIAAPVQKEVRNWMKAMKCEQEPQYKIVDWVGNQDLLRVHDDWILRVTSPEREAVVSVHFPVQELTANEALWLVVAAQDEFVYPQWRAIIKARDGPACDRRVYLGEPNIGQGETFEIMLIRAVPSLSQELSTITKASRSWFNERVPESLIKAHVTVKRTR
jgi:hypothetical protein